MVGAIVPTHTTLASAQQSSLTEDINADMVEQDQTEIQPGRLSIVCINAANLRRKDGSDNKTSLKLFITLTLGLGCKNTFVQRSKVYECSSQNPSFQNEILSFDIQEPKLIMCRDSNGNYDVNLKVEVFDTNSIKSFMVGSANIAINNVMSGAVFQEQIPLLQKDDKTSNSSINLQLMYQPVRQGMLMVTLIESKKLRLPHTDAIPVHTCLHFSVGQNVEAKSTDMKEETGHASYSSEKIFLDINKENWFHAMKTKILNLSTKSHDKFGEHLFNILPLMSKSKNNSSETQEDSFELHLKTNDEDGCNVGIVYLRIKFLPSIDMHVKLLKAKSLNQFERSSFLENMNPYVVLKSKGRVLCPQYRSRTVAGGGFNPTWNEEFSFPVVDHRVLTLECYNDDCVTNTHTLIGGGQLDLIPAYRNMNMSKWVKLTKLNEYGGTIQSGEVNIEVKFQQEVDSAFPYLHGSTDFAPRTNLSSLSEERLQQVLVQKTAFQNNDDVDVDNFCNELSDEDIKSTFAFLDLDKNGYIGAGELRHVLINMGELITDEEVDTMISMLDTNGDGQVSFQQFEAMARNPNLSQTEAEESKRGNGLKVPKSQNLHQGGDYSGNVMKQQNTLFLDFIVNNKITKSDIMVLRDYFLQRHHMSLSNRNQDNNADKISTVPWSINFQEFCEILPIEATGESVQVFTLFNHKKANEIDLREVILSLCNFMGSFSVEEKCSMVFELFDDGRDFITPEDLKVILLGTHLKPLEDLSLSRKVQTILSYVDKHGTNRISKELFRDISVKFPNLLLPKKLPMK